MLVEGCPSGGVSAGDFDPRVHGFGFENYTNAEMRTNLTEADVWRLFGDDVCESGSGEGCELPAPARQVLRPPQAATPTPPPPG